eukprot:scaffold1474_cov132-Cylindrotheca_fusiformis.AAC.2
MSRSSTKGGVAVKKTVLPPEIPELKNGQMSTVQMCVQFVSPSNREGDLAIRFDIKSSTGGAVPVEIRPRVGELLRVLSMKVDDFDSSFRKMQGFQRVSTAFTIAPAGIESLPQFIWKEIAFTPIGSLGWTVDGKLRMAGCLPATNDTVLALIECDKMSGSGTITTCCDHAVAGNSILNSLKQAVTKSG